MTALSKTASLPLFVTAITFVLAMPADAEETAIRFDIPAQDLGEALNEFALQSGQEILYVGHDVEGRSAPGIEGSYEPTEALNLLLADTSLSYEVSELDTILVGSTSVAGGDSEAKNSRSQPTLMAQSQAPPTRTYATQPNESAEEGADIERLEEIVVTGSRIRGAQNASPVVTIRREDIDIAGFATVEEVVENLPQNFNAGATSDARGSIENRRDIVGGNVQANAGGTSINLRGLGASSTLVLLNGHRMSPSGEEARFTNIASIPVSAIDRIEVMTDGASAIYGSDAIGGVINFILREEYEGAETRLRYGSDVRGGTSNVQLGQSFGTSWDSGNALLTYEYYDSEPLAARDRDFTASNDLSPFGGTDRRQLGGNPANIRTGRRGERVFWAIPTGQDGTSLTASDFDADSPPHLLNGREVVDQIGAVDRHSGFLHLVQDVGDIELFTVLRYSREENETRLNPRIVDITVTEDSPFFVDPTGTGLTSVLVDNYFLFDDFGHEINLGQIDSSGATLGVRFDINETWRAEFVGNWAKEEAKRWFANEVDLTELRAAANLTDPALAFNPFGDGPNTSPAVIESLVDRGRRLTSASENELWSASLNVDGRVFDAPGGAVRIATGLDFRKESLDSLLDQIAAVVTSGLSRDIKALYGEVFIPVVGNANSRTALQRLEISLAARYEDYSDFGGSINPKVGLVWAPTQTLTLRGTWGTSYRAPALSDLDDAINSNFDYIPENFFGFGNIPFLGLSGRNPELGPEEATTWTAGFQWNPAGIEGFSLEATYFNVGFTGRIEIPTSDFFGAAANPRFASIVTMNPTPEQIAAVVNDPLFDPNALVPFGLGPFPAADLIAGTVPLDAIVDVRLTNLAESAATGADLQFSYRFETGLGSFNLGLNGSYMFDFKRRLLEIDPLFDEVDEFGRPVDFRARSSLSWNRGNAFAIAFVNYTDGYTDNVSVPARAVDSWTTMDLTLGYRFGEGVGLLNNSRVTLTVLNLFNEDPPFVDTRAGVGYDATQASPLGQFFSLQLTKGW